MFKYSSIYINLFSFFISLIIFFIINFFFSNYENFLYKSSLKASFEVQNIVNQKEEIQEKNITLEEKEEETNEWYLEIPKIDLKANIKEGTTKEIMEDYIGHFEETSKDNGNVGLAAHNRGYKNNYFQNLKKLEKGDIILYNYKGNKKEYEVIKHEIIKDTNWNYLESTDENFITLITCVENEPEYRRCIQGKEVIESEVR